MVLQFSTLVVMVIWGITVRVLLRPCNSETVCQTGSLLSLKAPSCEHKHNHLQQHQKPWLTKPREIPHKSLRIHSRRREETRWSGRRGHVMQTCILYANWNQILCFRQIWMRDALRNLLLTKLINPAFLWLVNITKCNQVTAITLWKLLLRQGNLTYWSVGGSKQSWTIFC